MAQPDIVTSDLPASATREDLEAEGYFDRLIDWLQPLVGQTVCVTNIDRQTEAITKVVADLVALDFDGGIWLTLGEVDHPWEQQPDVVSHLDLSAPGVPYRVHHFVRVRRAQYCPESIRSSLLKRIKQAQDRGEVV